MSTMTAPAPVAHPELEVKEEKGSRIARTLGIITIVLGLVMAGLGAFTWSTVTDELAAQNITVSQDAEHLAGEEVNGPFTAYAQAQVIGVHAMESTDGQTYSEMDREDPARETAMNAALLQSSLYTSVIAFGVAALVMGLGAMFLMIGASVILLSRRRKS